MRLECSYCSFGVKKPFFQGFWGLVHERTCKAAVQRTWHKQDSQGQNMALVFRQKSSTPGKLFPLCSKSAAREEESTPQRATPPPRRGSVPHHLQRALEIVGQQRIRDAAPPVRGDPLPPSSRHTPRGRILPVSRVLTVSRRATRRLSRVSHAPPPVRRDTLPPSSRRACEAGTTVLSDTMYSSIS